MSHAEKALQAPNPYNYCVANFERREAPWGESWITFYFADGSELTFDIRYEVRQEAQERVA
jgi:hypothetical protein